MRRQFSLFQSHLDLAHAYWQELIEPGDIVVDATCGNGHDALYLAQLALTATSGQLWVFDIQPEALLNSQKLLSERLSPDLYDRISWKNRCHSQFPPELLKESVRLICYNLGYLPGGDKKITTKTESTLKSIQRATELAAKGGAISVMLYPGHYEGAKEAETVIQLAQDLPSLVWSCCLHQWINRHAGPQLLLMQKRSV